MSEKPPSDNLLKTRILIISLLINVFLIYFFSNPKPQNHFDYTFRVAENFLSGRIAIKEKPLSWLNEFVPFEGSYYSVFPLGSVLTMMPFAALKIFGLISEMPAAFISALLASLIFLFLFLIARKYEYGLGKIILLAAAILFGTWMWTNLAFGGAWQLALGFAVLGEAGAIYFTIFQKKPLLAGLFFALAFGNRTEILLTAPIFLFLLTRREFSNQNLKAEIFNFKSPAWRQAALFCAIPFVLGVSTLIYNYVRFHSITDFGYARIPGVLDEPWYKHGIFSVYYIPRQIYEMLFKFWEMKAYFPYLKPDRYSNSILFSSPFLFLLLRFGARDKIIKYSAWAAIILLVIPLWMHGNSGGWQFGYRYAMILLPWIFLILTENSPKKITVLEWALIALSFLLNLYATYLFHWTKYI